MELNKDTVGAPWGNPGLGDKQGLYRGHAVPMIHGHLHTSRAMEAGWGIRLNKTRLCIQTALTFVWGLVWRPCLHVTGAAGSLGNWLRERSSAVA